MTKIGAHIAYISVITVLLVALAFIIKNHNETQPNEEVIRQRDTVVVKVTDTLETEKPVPVYSKVVEEKIIYVHDTVFVSIPISEYRFYEKGKYDIIARGHDVQLSSVKVFPQSTVKVITNTVTKEVYKNEWNLFATANLRLSNGIISPSMGLCLSPPNKWLIGLDFGLYGNKAIYGVTVGYKLF